jgi:hypothetical protein
MAWAYERPNGGRGFGFTGGDIHKNWAVDPSAASSSTASTGPPASKSPRRRAGRAEGGLADRKFGYEGGGEEAGRGERMILWIDKRNVANLLKAGH